MLSPQSTAAAQCAADVSKARIFAICDASGGDGAHFQHFGDVVAKQVLDPHFQRQGRGGAARAGALHVQVDHAPVEAVEGDVATFWRWREARRYGATAIFIRRNADVKARRLEAADLAEGLDPVFASGSELQREPELLAA